MNEPASPAIPRKFPVKWGLLLTGELGLWITRSAYYTQQVQFTRIASTALAIGAWILTGVFGLAAVVLCFLNDMTIIIEPGKPPLNYFGQLTDSDHASPTLQHIVAALCLVAAFGFASLALKARKWGRSI